MGEDFRVKMWALGGRLWVEVVGCDRKVLDTGCGLCATQELGNPGQATHGRPPYSLGQWDGRPPCSHSADGQQAKGLAAALATRAPVERGLGLG